MSTDLPSSNTSSANLVDAPAARPFSLDTRTSMLPDVAADAAPIVQGKLNRVGMSGIEVAIRLRDANGDVIRTPARVDAYVSLDDPEVKGIHMSRLYLCLQDSLDDEFGRAQIETILQRFLETHSDISATSYLRFSYELMVRRESLLSDHSAWRSYPVEIEAWSSGGKVTYRVHVRLTYSSACPCSAALARQLLQQQFEEQFFGHHWLSTASVLNWLGSNETLMAVPHSQRSHADITIELDGQRDDLPIDELINCTEGALNTAVQAAVKRTDEQEFARLNGENLMFCEDAARRLKNAVDSMQGIIDYRIQASHFESLHPHDAVAIVTKGVPGGLTA
ncbi:GTP cyclohydrolase FolE2 [Blastopirellula sp. J2-11]|uniref:GTP cyclohydrolase FolE2 n=1 Tax=Blastopirellula sp. J2-11 TaxID=2943192 RepID=UPI0021CA6CFA|nr:GTP cyclohydrolase FolE2 [Blastopirellula sp. J2-11]UUO08076.1 GTP cyclohydrolase FolE2 [Blastopirellula sp. J2-11]